MEGYQVGDKRYTQRKLVMGQVEQLVDLLHDTDFQGGLGVREVVAALGDKLYTAMAIVLREDGAEHWYEKDLDAMAASFRWDMEVQTAVEVVKDFFDCNPVTSLLDDLTGMEKTLRGQIEKMAERTRASGTGQAERSFSSAQGTSPEGSTSVGA